MMSATNRNMQWPNLLPPLSLMLIGFSACSEVPSAKKEAEATPATRLARADRDSLQAKATAACECDLVKGKNCWSEYRAATKRFRSKKDEDVFEAASACAPISTTIDCMKDGEGPFCVVTGYEATGVNLPQPRLCRQEEAQAIEHAFNAEFAKRSGNQANADRAANEALAAVRAGKASKVSSASSGCV